MSIDIRPHVEERLRTDTIAWLSTVRTDGRPHTIPLWFLWDGSVFFIFSKVNTQKVRNLRQKSSVMLALDDTKGGFDVVMITGKAELLPRSEGLEALPAYEQKYHTGLQRIGVSAEQFTMLYAQLIRITPERVITGQ